MRPTILVLFNSSMYAAEPWLEDGDFNVVSVDYHETDHSDVRLPYEEGPQAEHVGLWRFNVDLSRGFRSVQEVEQKLSDWGLGKPAFVLSFAPCTDLAVAGAKHFERKRKENPFFQVDAVAMARLVEYWDCPSIVENPVSVLASMWKKPTGYVHPWEFAGVCPEGPHPEAPDLIPPRDMYNKKTGLWCQNGALMPAPFTLTGYRTSDNGGLEAYTRTPDDVDFPGWKKLGGKSARTKHLRSLTPRGMAWSIYYTNAPKVMLRAQEEQES